MRFFISLGIAAFIVLFGLAYLAFLTTDKRVNLNTADRQQLVDLPGIGEVMADRIIENRPITSWEQLSKILGVGDQRLKALEGKVVFP
jgi:competence protein ComEA